MNRTTCLSNWIFIIIIIIIQKRTDCTRSLYIYIYIYESWWLIIKQLMRTLARFSENFFWFGSIDLICNYHLIRLNYFFHSISSSFYYYRIKKKEFSDTFYLFLLLYSIYSEMSTQLVVVKALKQTKNILHDYNYLFLFVPDYWLFSSLLLCDNENLNYLIDKIRRMQQQQDSNIFDCFIHIYIKGSFFFFF